MSVVELGYVKYYIDEQKNEAYVDGPGANLPNSWGIEIVSGILGTPVTKIRQGAFYKCNKIKSVVIPESVIEIRQKAFAFCKNLTHIKHYAKNTVRIGSSAFDGCDELQIIDSNATYELVGNYVFASCLSLSSIPTLGGALYSMTLDRTPKLYSIDLATNTRLCSGSFSESSVASVVLHGDLKFNSDYSELKDKLLHIPAQSAMIDLAYEGYLIKKT